MTKGIHDQHRRRMRGRYEKEGLLHFEPHEVMEILLYDAIPRVNTNPIGHELVNAFGSLSAVFMASEEELCRVKGIGPVSAALIRSVRDEMLFTLLGACDFQNGNDALAMAAEYHMRTLAEGAVSVLSRETVLDYESDDGVWTGLSDAVTADLAAHGITAYAVVVKGGDSSEALAALGAVFPNLYLLKGTALTRVPNAALTKKAKKQMTDKR